MIATANVVQDVEVFLGMAAEASGNPKLLEPSVKRATKNTKPLKGPKVESATVQKEVAAVDDNSPPNTRDSDEEPDLINADLLDAAETATAILDSSKVGGFRTITYQHGAYGQWSAGRYISVSDAEVRGAVVRSLNQTFCGLKTKHIADVMAQIQAMTIIPYRTPNPSWLPSADGITPTSLDPADILAFRDSIVHLPRLTAGEEFAVMPATPQYFCRAAADYEFQLDAPECVEWKKFLKQLWPDDQSSINLLQEWMGYCLTPDIRQQKIMLLIGPPRSGKGTIANTLRSILGDGNVAGPTPASFSSRFGLSGLIGKSLAIIGDGRFAGVDQATCVERMLSISGGDLISIDRKGKDIIDTVLSCRLMILSNETPRLHDPSGAIPSRMMPLRLTNDFLGREDLGLGYRLLAERAGILLWAIEGWRRLREQGRFTVAESGQDVAEMMDDLSSPHRKFVRTRCVVRTGATVSIPRIFEEWVAFCREENREPGVVEMFGRDLASAVPGLKVTKPRIGGKQIRHYEGIGLLASVTDF